MAYKAFLDINILVDFIDGSREEHTNAGLLFDNITRGKLSAFVSESVVNTTFYITQKLTTVQNFCLFVQDTLDFIKLLPCTNTDVLNACKIVKNDFEDAVLYQIALANRLDFFVTNDKKDFSRIAHPALKIVSAKELINLL